MRAEKGFVMIGDETDGTVIPQDLNLDWAISKKKDDYIGKRGQARSHLTSPDRWKLAGFETLDGSVIPDGSYIIAAGVNANGQGNTQGRVTSTYHSPTLGKGIAMGLIRGGLDRLGEVVEFNTVPRRDGEGAGGRSGLLRQGRGEAGCLNPSRPSATPPSPASRASARSALSACSPCAPRPIFPVSTRHSPPLGVTRPEPRRIARGQDRACGWMSPDEYLILLPYDEAAAAEASLAQALSGRHHLVVNVSDARAIFRIEGAKADQVLRKLMPVDFDRLERNELRRSRAAQTAAAVWAEDEGFTLVCFRSAAGYVMGLLTHSAMPGSDLD